MNYDDLLAILGNFSGYQLRNYVMLCIPIILCAFHKLSNVFILGKMGHRCRLTPEESINSSFSLTNEILTTSYPMNENGKFSNCSFFTDHFFAKNKTIHDELQCAGDYIWDESKFQSSALQEFELVCDRNFYKASSDSLFMIGVFAGSFAFGHLSDKFGRRKVFVLSLISQLIFGFLTAFSTSFLTFTIFRMVSWSRIFEVFFMQIVSLNSFSSLFIFSSHMTLLLKHCLDCRCNYKWGLSCCILLVARNVWQGT